MSESKRHWDWTTKNNYHYVKILEDGSLEWGGWETFPHGGGGSASQAADDFIRTGVANYSWTPPARIIDALTAELQRKSDETDRSNL